MTTGHIDFGDIKRAALDLLPEHAHAPRPIGAFTIVRLVSRPIPAVAGEGGDHAQR